MILIQTEAIKSSNDVMLLSSMRLVTGCINLSSLLFKEDHTCVVIITTMLRE